MGGINLLYGQTIVSGFVKEAGSEELLVGVNMYCEELKTGTSTNDYGYFVLAINDIDKQDSLTLKFSMIGYDTYRIIIKSGDTNNALKVSLQPTTEYLEEVVVFSDNKISEIAPLGHLKLTTQEIQDIPSLMGEKDIFKAIKLTPGIQKGTDGSSFLLVRGGAPDQNLVLLDGATVYNAFHLAGFFSTVNSDAIRNIEFVKGNFPSKYGGRLSSVVDILMREGNRKQFQMEGGIGLISSRLTVEGPLSKTKKSSFILSGKRSYFDLLYAPFAPDDRKDLYHLYDLSAKINFDISNKDKLFFSSYTGGDKYSFQSIGQRSEREMNLKWRNYTSTLRWTHILNPKTFINNAIVFSDYTLNQSDLRVFKNRNGLEISDEEINYKSLTRNISLKTSINTSINNNGFLKGGIDISKQIFRPESIFIKNSLFSEIDKNEVDKINVYQGAVFLENEGSLFNVIDYTAGLRFNKFWTIGDLFYQYLEPRISVSKQFSKRFSAKIGYAHTSQFVSLLSNDGLGFPLDIWIPATDRVQPQLAKQISIGLFSDLTKFGLQISLEGYYKKLSQINRLKEGEIVFSGDAIDLQRFNFLGQRTWEDKLTQGKGWSYGTELLIKKPKGRLSGWLGYTLAWTTHQFEAFNQGRKFSPWYDRRHNLSLVGVYRISKNITISGSWQFTSGQFLTVYDSKFTGVTHSPWTDLGNHTGQSTYNFDNKSNVRISPFHRLDAGIRFHKDKRWGSRTWEISIINVYNQKNPAFFFPEEVLKENNITQRTYKQITLFPFIPSISYNFKFSK